MRMTPLEIQSHRFAQRRRGYDRDEVEAFLQMVTEDYEALVMESAEQRESNRQLEEQLEATRGQETLLRETLISAQSISDQMRAATDKECQARLSQAESKARETLEASQREVARLTENIRELRGLRTRIAESLRTVIQTQLGWVDQLMAQPDPGARSPKGLEPALASGARTDDAPPACSRAGSEPAAHRAGR
ncbi:MAG: DivIVA domain-containing protein [Myxococcota bacterium]